MLQLTSRDEAMLDWMNVVRLADVDAIRWALSAYQDHHDGPVSVRRANHWIARMAELGYLGRTRPVYRDRQIVWPTYQASGRVAPRLFRQTMRHELAVAAASGRFLAAGFEWTRDRRPQSNLDHQTDGIATNSNEVRLIEVELTPKSTGRYRQILTRLARRLEKSDASRVLYLGTAEAVAVVRREADELLFREIRPRLTTHGVMDQFGRWTTRGEENVRPPDL